MPRKSKQNTRPSRRRFPIGPATILAVAVAVAAIASGALSGGPAKILPPQVPAIAETGMVRPTAPLRKPEVGELLRHAEDLHLTARQRAAIGRLDAAWRAEKAAMLEAMHSETDGAQTGSNHKSGGVSIQVLREGLATYADLSRRYDLRRADYWTRARASLTASQRAGLDAPDGGSVR